MNFFEMEGNYEQRKVANTEVDGGVVDTCAVTDSSLPFETGISHPAYNKGRWIIVELYSTRQEAVKGHEKWVEILKQKPTSLTDVNQSEISRLVRVFGVDTHQAYERG